MSHLQSNLIAAVIGVTVGVISAASILIYQKIIEKQQQTTTVSNLHAANKKISELQEELEAIQLQVKQQKKKRKISRKGTSNDSTYTVGDNDMEIDAFSAADTDIGDDEFYDCSDSESITGDNDFIRITDELNHVDLVLNEIDEHADDDFDIETYYKLQTLAKAHSDDVDIIWRFARICYQYSENTSDLNEKKEVIQEGIRACENIIEFPHADLFKWYAILIGINGEYLPLADKIKNGDRFKNYIIMALKMRPNDSQLHHLLGRFNYEVASLSWFEKKIASTLFSELSSASYEDAISSFEEAEKLGSKHPENLLFLSKAYIALSQYEKAVDRLEQIVKRPALTQEDKKIQTEANKLFSKYSGYNL